MVQDENFFHEYHGPFAQMLACCHGQKALQQDRWPSLGVLGLAGPRRFGLVQYMAGILPAASMVDGSHAEAPMVSDWYPPAGECGAEAPLGGDRYPAAPMVGVCPPAAPMGGARPPAAPMGGDGPVATMGGDHTSAVPMGGGIPEAPMGGDPLLQHHAALLTYTTYLMLCLIRVI